MARERIGVRRQYKRDAGIALDILGHLVYVNRARNVDPAVTNEYAYFSHDLFLTFDEWRKPGFLSFVLRHSPTKLAPTGTPIPLWRKNSSTENKKSIKYSRVEALPK